MSFRKGLKSVTQSRLERGSRYLRHYDTRCNIGLEKDRYNLVESSTSVATESSTCTSLCTENSRAVSSSSQSRRVVDRERCNKSRDRGKDQRKEETLGSAALGARMFSNKCHRSSNFPSSQYKKLNSEANEFNSKSNYLEANDENMSSAGMDTFTVENIGFSQPKSFKQNKEVDKNDSLKRQKTLEFLEKLLKNCDPEIEEQLNKLVKEKFGLHMKSSHQKEVLSSNHTINGIMEFLEQQKNDSFLSCNSSRISSLSSRSKNDWSKLRADNNRNLIKSSKSFLSKNRMTESTPSFVLGESNLNEDSDESVFYHGENCSENKLARNCTSSNSFETKSNKDFSNSPQHDMWDTIHQVLNEQKLENQFWQKATSIKNNFETKLPNFMDKSSTEDSTIKNILKSIGFDTEMCKRMQECAKQVSGINDQLGSDKDKQLTNKSKHSMSPEIDKCGLKRAKNKILSSEKASHKILFNKNLIATIPPIDTSVPPPVVNFSNTITPLPPPAPLPLPTLHSRPPVHSVLPSGLPTPIAPANYNHVPSQPAIAPCGPFLTQPQASNLFPQQYNFSNMFERNTCYSTSKSIIPTTVPPPPVHSNLKVIPLSTVPTSNSSIPSATTPSSLPGSSLCRDNSPKTDSWLSNNERSSQWNLLSPSHRDRSPPSSRRNRSLTPCSSRHTSYTIKCERSQVPSSSKQDKSYSPLSSRRGRSRTPSSLRRDKSRDRSLTPSKSRRKKSRNQNKRNRSRTPYSSKRSHSRSPCSLKRDRPRSPVSGRSSRYSKSRHSRSPSKPCNFHSKRSKLLHPVDERFASDYEYSPSPPLQRKTGSSLQCNGSTEDKNASSLKVQDVKEIFALKSKNLNASTNNSNRKYSCFLPHEIEQIIKQRILCSSRLEILQNELTMLRKQQNELMRKKQREKDGHKDPLLTENAALQEEVSNQVKLLKKTMEELTETLEISGMSMESFTYHEKFYQYSKKSSLSDQFGFKSKSHETRANEKDRKTNKFHSHGFDKTASIQKEMSCERFSSRDKPLLPLEIKSFAKGSQSSDKDKFSWNKRMDDSQLCEDKDKKISSFPLKWSAYSSENLLHNLHENKDMTADYNETRPNKAKVSYEYFDPGNHWCRHCNLVTGNIYELFHHLQSKKHKAKLDHYDRPWLPESIKNPSNKPKMGQVQMAPIKGVEFLMSTHAFYCTLCKEFSGDVLCAEAHLKSDSHNTTYQKHIQENPYYEKRLNLDKAAGLQFFTSDKGEKRKNTEDSETEERKDSFKKIQHDSKEKCLEENKETEALSKDLIKDTKTDTEISAETISEEIQKENFENNNNKKVGLSSSCENKPKNEQDETKVTVLEASSAKSKILDQAKSTIQRSKIAIKLTGKTVIKPLQYPVLPPSIPVGKMPGRHKKRNAKPGFGKKVWPVKEVENQLSLDDFLTCSNNHGSVPVVSDIETDEERTDVKTTNINTSRQSADTSILQESIDNTENKKSQKFLPESHTSTIPVSATQMSGNCLLPIDVLATAPPPPPLPVNAYKNTSNAFGETENSDVYTFPPVEQKPINMHELNKRSEAKIISESKKGARTLLNQQKYETQTAVSTGVSTKSEEFSAEDLDDMRLLGIDPASQVPMAEVRPPPSLLSLTAHNMTNGDHKVKSKPIKEKNCVGSNHNISFVDNSTMCEKDGKQLESECSVSFDENKEQFPDESSQIFSETGQHTFEDKSELDQANLQFFTSDQRQRKENNKDSDHEEKKNNCKKIQFDPKENILEENKVTKVLLKDLIKDTKTDSETLAEVSEEIQKENFENNGDKKSEVSPNCEEKINNTKVTVIEESFVKDKILDQVKPTVQRSKITIKLTGKTGIKPLQYPVLSPWISTSKMPGPNKAQSAKVSSDKKLWSTKEVESQLLLDDILTYSNNHGSVPVSSDIETDEEKSDITIANLNTSRQSADASILQESIDNNKNIKSQEFLPESHMSTTIPVSVSQISGGCLLPISVLAATPFSPPPPESTCKNSSDAFEATESSDLCISLAVDQRSSNVHESNKESETKVISESKNGARTLLSQHKGTIQVPVSTGVKLFTRDLDKRLLGVDSISQVSMGKIHHSPPSVFQITETNDASLCQTDKENITLHSSVTLEGNSSNGSPPVVQETSLLVNKEHFPKICSNNDSDPLASSTSTLFDEINSKSCYSISALHSELSSVPSKLQLSDNIEPPSLNSALESSPSNLSTINTEEMKPDQSVVSSKSDAKNSCIENKDSCSLITLLSNSTRSDVRTVDSSSVEQNISLIPLPNAMNSSLANIWDIPLPSNLQSDCQPSSHGVLIRESEHNYAIRLMENSDGVLHPVKRVPLQHDDKNVDSDDSNNDMSNNSWKAESFAGQTYLSHDQSDDEGETSQLSISSENDSNNSLPQQCSQSSESNDTISPPVLEAEGRQSCLIPNEDLSNNDSPPPLTAEVPCLSPSVSLPCSTSSVIPVTLVCNSPCESKTLLTTPNTLSIDNSSLLNNMSILNLDSVIRNQANSVNHTSKTYSSNDRNVKSIKKVVLLKKPVQNVPSRHLRTSRKSRSKQNDVKLLKVDKVDQEKIIVKVTSRTSEGVPVISLTPATSTASYTTSDPSSTSVATTSSSGSSFTEISENETADSSLLEAAAKKAETLPKMFMPTVVLHDIKYTMGKDLSPMATIPSSIENIPIFDSENEDSDSDVKFESPKKSFESQRQLEIESPSKTAEAFDPYMFLNRPTKPSIPSSSYNTQLTNESSTLFSIGPCGTSATGRVTADSLPSIDNQSMISNMFDVTDCKFAFPDVFLENGEPETPPKLSNVDVLGPGLPFETSSKSNIALGLDILNEFYTAGGTEDSG